MLNKPTQSVFTKKLHKLIHTHLQQIDSQHTYCRNMYEIVMNKMERTLILSTLQHTNNSRSKSAEMLGIDRSTLSRKIKKHGIS